MNPLESFFFGPYGKAFAIMDEYQFLPTPENFTEFSEEMYEDYFHHFGMPAERLYQIHPGPHYHKENEILMASKTEMEEFLKAKAFIDDITLGKPELQGASDMERLNYVKANLDFLFKSHKEDEK